MLRSNRGPLILEVNSSPGLKGIESITNIDIAGKIIEYIEREFIKKAEKQ
jgi:ribosomal protein S6--L-glutamate ligase